MTATIIMGYKGGSGSGNWGHEGRPGKEGGSLPTGKSHGAIAPSPGHGGVLRAEQAMGTFGKVAPKAGWDIPVPQLSIPTGPVPEHEEGDADGKSDYQKWLESQAGKKISLADALAMRKYFADRARAAESERGTLKAEQTAADRQKRLAEERAKGPVLTPAQKKKQEAAAKKAATAAASAAKKKASEVAKAKKKAESDAAKAKKKAEADAKKAAAAKKPAASASKKKAEEAAAKKRQAAESKQETINKVAESVGLGSEGLSMFQEAFNTLKGGGQIAENVQSALVSAGLLVVSGDTVKVPTAARSLLSAILAGDALKAQDAMEKLKKSGGKEYIVGQVAVKRVGNHIIIG